MKRTIYLVAEIDWDDYDDVCDDLILEDSGILDSLKEGVVVNIAKEVYCECGNPSGEVDLIQLEPPVARCCDCVKIIKED